MRLHSGDSLGTGAAYAASVACAEEALLRREAASEAKRPKGPQGAALMRTECHAAFPGVPRKRTRPSARTSFPNMPILHSHSRSVFGKACGAGSEGGLACFKGGTLIKQAILAATHRICRSVTQYK